MAAREGTTLARIWWREHENLATGRSSVRSWRFSNTTWPDSPASWAFFPWIRARRWHVRFVPRADIAQLAPLPDNRRGALIVVLVQSKDVSVQALH